MTKSSAGAWKKPSNRQAAIRLGGGSRCAGSSATAQSWSDRSGGHGLSGDTGTPKPSGRLNRKP